MRVFLTGGSGFIGRHLLRRLRADGHDVIGAARSQASAASIVREGARCWIGRLDDSASLASTLRGVDAIVHAAAHIKMWAPIAEFEASNVDLTRSLLRSAIAAKTPAFVHVSAASVVMDEPGPLIDQDETAATCRSPDLPYSWTKARAEADVLRAASDHLRTIALRPPFVWGEGDAVDRDLGEAVSRGRFCWFGGGHYPYATCHVANLAEAVACALASDASARSCFVTDGEPVEFRRFMERRLRAAGLEPPRLSIPVAAAWAAASAAERTWRALGLRSAPPLTREAVRLIGYPFTVRIDAAARDIGYRPVVGMEDGFRILEAAHLRGRATARRDEPATGRPAPQERP